MHQEFLCKRCRFLWWANFGECLSFDWSALVTAALTHMCWQEIALSSVRELWPPFTPLYILHGASSPLLLSKASCWKSTTTKTVFSLCCYIGHAPNNTLCHSTQMLKSPQNSSISQISVEARVLTNHHCFQNILTKIVQQKLGSTYSKNNKIAILATKAWFKRLEIEILWRILELRKLSCKVKNVALLSKIKSWVSSNAR